MDRWKDSMSQESVKYKVMYVVLATWTAKKSIDTLKQLKYENTVN